MRAIGPSLYLNRPPVYLYEGVYLMIGLLSSVDRARGSASFRVKVGETRLSHGFVEGKNNRTTALMPQGYGYANRRHLRLRIPLEAAS
jgi:hypothetical protein